MNTTTSITKADGRRLRLAGTAEACEILGLSRNAGTRALARPDAPAPIARIAATPVWDVDDIEAFAKIPRKTGRPRKHPATA